MKPDTVHIAMTDSGTVACITADPVIAESLAEQDLSVEMDASALVALQRLQGEAPWRRLADDEAWQRVSRAMTTFERTIAPYDDGDTTPLFPTTPPDFPPMLIEGRSAVIESYARAVDIPAMRELTEIQMAWIQKREVDHSHFRAESLQTSWGKMKHEPLAVMYAHLDELHSKIQHDVGEDARQHKAAGQLMREIQFVIDSRRSESADHNQDSAGATSSADLFHAIYTSTGDLTKITMNDTESSMAQAEGLTVVTNTTADELLDDLIGCHSLLDLMDKQTWQSFAKTVLDTIDRDGDPLVFSVNSYDLPLPLAERRLDIVERFMDPSSLRSWVELSEIVMAREQQRPVDASLLNAESAADRFADRYKVAMDTLEQQHEWAQNYAHELGCENASEQAAFGDSGPGSAKAAALANYVEYEAKFLVDHWPAMQDDQSDDDNASLSMR